MIKNIAKFETEIEDRTYQLLCELDSPIGHAKEFVFQFLKYLGQVEDNLKAQMEELKAKKEEKENVDVEPAI